MAWDDNLTGAARDIASSSANRLRVMAGPGTGKSFALKRRVARLLEEGIDPSHILVVTLTRNAAKELKKDLKNLNAPNCERVEVGTLHSFCMKVLFRNSVLTYLQRTPRLLMEFESKPLVQDLVALGGFGKVRQGLKRIKAFEAAWARMQHEIPGWPQDQIDKRFHTEMIDWLKFHQALRVGELVPLVLRYRKDNPEAVELSAYDHVVVDEFQDLNKAEQQLVALIANDAQYAIVGDEDQSIYGFRYAHPEGIREFSAAHPGTQDVQLDECRRCPKKIVKLADALILHNHPRKNPHHTCRTCFLQVLREACLSSL